MAVQAIPAMNTPMCPCTTFAHIRRYCSVSLQKPLAWFRGKERLRKSSNSIHRRRFLRNTGLYSRCHQHRVGRRSPKTQGEVTVHQFVLRNYHSSNTARPRPAFRLQSLFGRRKIPFAGAMQTEDRWRLQTLRPKLSRDSWNPLRPVFVLMHWQEIERYEVEHKIYRFYESANQMFDVLNSKRSINLHRPKESFGRVENQAFGVRCALWKLHGEGDCKVCGKGQPYSRMCQTATGKHQCGNLFSGCKHHWSPSTEMRIYRIPQNKWNRSSLRAKDRINLFHGGKPILLNCKGFYPDRENGRSLFDPPPHSRPEKPSVAKLLDRYYANHVPMEDGKLWSSQR